MLNTEFKQAVATTLLAIPSGKVIAYGQLASLAGFPGYHRQVAKHLQSLPNGEKLPWFRVVRADGSIAFPVDSEMFRRQKQHLVDEGIVFKNNKVPKRFFY